MLQLIPVFLGLLALACQGQDREKPELGPLYIGPEPQPPPRVSSSDPFKQKGEQAVEKYFHKLCGGYFVNKNDQPQQYCSRLWRNESLQSTDQQVRDKIYAYATLPLTSDLDPKLSYQDLKIRPALEADLEKLMGRN
jgi:hypothetical protein